MNVRVERKKVDWKFVEGAPSVQSWSEWIEQAPASFTHSLSIVRAYLSLHYTTFACTTYIVLKCVNE